MKIAGEHVQSIWYDLNCDSVKIIDQTLLPHEFAIVELNTLSEVCDAICGMKVRGAPLIGVTAAYGVYLSLREDPDSLQQACSKLLETRPTAINLKWALERMKEDLSQARSIDIADKALEQCQLIEKEDILICESIGEAGAPILQELWESRKNSQRYLNILTHCNAGALAAVDWGTAMSVIYKASDHGIPVHVWVDETRPRNQGANLTSYELNEEGISNTVITDNAGGILMQRGEVDMCIVGTDRTLSNGDVCNKIGTYLKALSAKDNNVPFYVALPSSTIDWSIKDHKQIPIEERNSEELSHVEGVDENNEIKKVRIYPKKSKSLNLAFDVTPAKLVTGLITEKGVCEASEKGLKGLFK